MNHRLVPTLAALAHAGFAAHASAATYTQGFDGASLPADWVTINNSTDAADGSPWGTTVATTGGTPIVPHSGAGFAVSNYTATGADVGTISNWLISPEFSTIKNGDVFSFYTQTAVGSTYPDRLEFRLSSAGIGTNVGSAETDVGTFTTTLATVNSTLAVGGYPTSWSLVSVTISGLAAPIDGRVAFRYFVTDAGLFGDNSDIIGVDDFSYTTTPAAAVPEPESWALLMGGLGALGAFARRRQARQN